MSIYPWQQALWQHLLTYVNQQRIPQALLFTGAMGSGKRHLAERYANLLLCPQPINGMACGHCANCKLFQAKTHPDYIVIEPEEPGKNIGIDQIRNLIQQLNLKPQFTAYRPVILQPADQLNTASANALLKCLEEPNERTCFILISAHPSKLPATITSRCQKLNCSVTEADLALTWLNTQGLHQNSQLLLNMAYGAPLQAKLFAEREYVKLRKDCFDIWLDISKNPSKLLTASEQWQKSDVSELSILFSWLCSWVSDIVRLDYGADSHLLENPDLQSALQPLAKRLNRQKIYAYYDKLLLSKAQLTTTLNKQLLIEQVLIDWWQINQP